MFEIKNACHNCFKVDSALQTFHGKEGRICHLVTKAWNNLNSLLVGGWSILAMPQNLADL